MSNSSPENFSTNRNSASSNEEIVSIVHQSSRTDEIASYSDDAAYAVFVPSQPNSIQERPLWLESLLTPWGVGSLLLIVLANSLLSWAKWSQSYSDQTPTLSTTNEASKINPSQASPVGKSSTLSLDSLSTATPAQPQIKSNIPPQTLPQRVTSAKAPTKPVVVVKPKTDLTSALLPPSVQPQFASVQTIPQPTSPTVLVKTPVPAPVTPIAKPAVGQIPTANTSDPATMRTINERILEEMRLREEERRNMPFIQKAKARKQAIQSRQSLNQVLDNMEQQRPIQPPQPAIPNTLVIDGRNPGNNTNQ